MSIPRTTSTVAVPPSRGRWRSTGAWVYALIAGIAIAELVALLIVHLA